MTHIYDMHREAVCAAVLSITCRAVNTSGPRPAPQRPFGAFAIMKKKLLLSKFSRDNFNEDSFYSKNGSPSQLGTNLVDPLIDYLTLHLNHLNERNERLQKFEELTAEVLAKCADPDLHRIIKEQGWTGTQFQLAFAPPFIDAQSCLNALSNYYLKVNSQPTLTDIGTVVNIESSHLDQILPFCPDVLVTYLRKHPITGSGSGPRRLTFQGACMLADISGFSKFSGAMCSKGVSGLDDLREATNGFLGYFVKQVYEYQGDVIEFAGDALICAFRSNADGMGEACFRALQCAHVLRQHKTAALSTHIGVTCGEMQIGLLGGHNDQWCYVMNGDCVSQLASCIEDAGPQEVAVTQECYDLAKTRDNLPLMPMAIKNRLAKEDVRKESGNYLLKAIGVHGSATPPPPNSPFVNIHPEEAVHHHHAWGALKYHHHVHEVATDVLIKQRSDHLVEDGRRAAMLNAAADSVTLSSTSAQASDGSITPPNKALNRKRSAVMETYVNTAHSRSSTPNDLATPPVILTPNKMNSPVTRAKLRMVSPVFNKKNNLSNESLQSVPSHSDSPVSSGNTCTHVSFPSTPMGGANQDSLKYSEKSSTATSETGSDKSDKTDKSLPDPPHQQNHLKPPTPVPRESSTRPQTKISTQGIAERAEGAEDAPPTREVRASSDPDAVLLALPPRRASQNGHLRQNSGDHSKAIDMNKAIDISSAAGRVPPSKSISFRSQSTFSRDSSVSSMTEGSLFRGTSPVPSMADGAVPFSSYHNPEAVNSLRSPLQMTMSRQNSMDQAKKRFAGWGVMKKAMRRESFHDKYGSTEDVFIQTISKFVPRPVLNAVHTECLDLIGELRQVTTMFCGLNSYSDVDNRDPCTLQPFFLMAQTVLHEAGGFLRQFLVDDKGCVFIAMWGVPSFTYSNNCSRALYCAAKIIAGSKELNHSCSIGIATGTVFCGSVGALERRDYAGVGTDVNMAARLMGKAKGRVLIDQATYKSLNPETQALLTQAEEMHLKGMAAPTFPYQYASQKLPTITDMDVEANQHSVLRPKMQTALTKLLDAFLNISANTDTQELLDKKMRVKFIFLFGLPGTGKSLAAQFYRNNARLRSINCIHLVAKSDAQGIPYGLLRELFLELIGRANFATLEQKLDVIGRIIDEICDNTDSEDDRNSAIQSLQLVLGIEPGDMETIRDSILNRASTLTASGKVDVSNYLTSHFSDEEEVSPTREGMLGRSKTYSQSRKGDDYTFYNVVAHLLHNTPTVLIIENAHYIDELSWKEFYLMQAGDQLDMSVLLTMEVAHIPAGRYQTDETQQCLSQPSVKKPAMSMQKSMAVDYWDAKEGVDWDSPDSPPGGDTNETDGLDALFKPTSPDHPSTRLVGRSPLASHSTLSMDDEPERTMSIRNHPTEFWCSILDNRTSTVLVIGELSKAEIRQEMERSLDPKVLTDGLVDLVFTITAGNAYWCNAMTQFIRERGAEALFTAVSDRRSRQNPLKQLVLVHFETHTPEFQVISKHASIIGVEFDEEVLKAIVPAKLKPTLAASLDKLVEKRFLQCLDPQDRTFCFPNQLIQATIYELTPPRDAAHLHQAIAEHLETAFMFEVRSHYPTLGYHYKRCPDKRPLAFKYELKAADQQVAKGAYSDGYTFLKSAAKLAEREVELDVVLEVIDRAIEDIREESKSMSSPASNTIMRLQSFYTGSTDTRSNGFILRYNTLKKLVLRKKDSLHKTSQKAITSEKNVDKKKELLLKAREDENAARLTWQPSYVAGKRDNSINSTAQTSKTNSSLKSEHGGDAAAAHAAGCKCIIS